jgi:hypothetical protein
MKTVARWNYRIVRMLKKSKTPATVRIFYSTVSTKILRGDLIACSRKSQRNNINWALYINQEKQLKSRKRFGKQLKIFNIGSCFGRNLNNHPGKYSLISWHCSLSLIISNLQAYHLCQHRKVMFTVTGLKVQQQCVRCKAGNVSTD